MNNIMVMVFGKKTGMRLITDYSVYDISRFENIDIDHCKEKYKLSETQCNTLRSLREFMVSANVTPLRNKIRSHHDVHDVMKNRLYGLKIEKFWLLILNGQNEVITIEELYEGTYNSCTIYRNKIIRTMLVHNACACILVHNHPSGHTEPSSADIGLTKKVVEASAIIGFDVLDHVIVADGYRACKSMREVTPHCFRK